jgi:hypothetical protein
MCLQKREVNDQTNLERAMNKIRPITAGCLLAMTLVSSGCSLCCSPYLDDYSAFGSRTPRIDMKHGRVGSILSDPNLVGRPTIEAEPTINDPHALEPIPLDDSQTDGLEIGPR